MHEVNGVLVQDLENGSAMQVKLGADRLDVRVRFLPIANMDNVVTETPHWDSAYDHGLAGWIGNDSPVWQWLKAKGIDAAAVQRRLAGLV